MKNKKELLLFLLIGGIAIFLRLYNLSSVPPGINQDEGSIGYTAYSILHTGKDEYGRSFPFSFQSFGDWKLPLYIYITLPFAQFFGLSELAVRLPSALFGIGTVIVTYFLVRQLFQNKTLAFLTMILMAIAPWALHLSRVESESNTAVFLTSLGVLVFLKSLKNRSWFLVIAAILLALTYFTYAGNHIFTTLLVIGLCILYRKDLLKNKWIVPSAGVFLLLAGFIFVQTFFGADRTKISGIGIFGDPSVVHAKIELPRNEHENPNSLFAKFVHNRVSFAIERISQNYLNAFSPQFLFIKGGDNKAHNIENFGNMYLIESVFLVWGLVYLLTTKKTREHKLVLLWFFIAPVAASITKDAPHTNRMFAIFPILPLITTFGLYECIQFINKYFRTRLLFKYITLAIIVCLFFWNFSLYMDRYYVHFPRNQEESWGNGYKELSQYLDQQTNKLVIMGRPEYSPYIFLAFYQKYDPNKYQKEAVRYPYTPDGFLPVKKFSRYEFRTINWGEDLKIKNRILIDYAKDVPQYIKDSSYSKREIILRNGKPMFIIIET